MYYRPVSPPLIPELNAPLALSSPTITNHHPSTTPQKISSIKPPTKKRKTKSDELDEAIINTLKDFRVKEREEVKDEEYLCSPVGLYSSSIDSTTNALVKLQIKDTSTYRISRRTVNLVLPNAFINQSVSINCCIMYNVV